jgi:hypothetical protein
VVGDKITFVKTLPFFGNWINLFWSITFISIITKFESSLKPF